MPDVLEYLLATAHCDPNQTNHNNETPLFLLCCGISYQKEDHHKAIHVLLCHKATPPDGTWEKMYLRKPAEAFSKLFIMGYPQAGKSTLAMSLRTDPIKQLTSKFEQVSGVEKHTTGIVPSDIKSQQFGNITIYDLAGHSEFYASHDLALRNVLDGSPSSIIVLVADMTRGKYLFEQSLLHWCSFASNLFHCSKNKPFLLIIGSYADQASSSDLEACKDIVENCYKRTRIFFKFHVKGFISLDCRYAVSVGMTKLRSYIEECCLSLKESRKTSFQANCLFVALTEAFSDRPAFTVRDILSMRYETASNILYLPLNYPLSILVDICTELNKGGHFLFLRNIDRIEDSWIVLQKDILLKRITGTIFAPTAHKDHKPLASDTGIVPASKLSKEFPDIDSDLIVSLMSHLQFCHEVTDPEILEQLSIVVKDRNKYFFFPSLVTVDTPEGIWEHTAVFSFESVWIMKCINDKQFFSSTFMHVTIHYFALKYAMAARSTPPSVVSIQRRCKVWKNGIFWRSLQGIDIVVEVDCKRVALYIRARKGCELSTIKLRTQLISTVLKTKQEYCKDVTVSEYFVGKDSISFPLPDKVVLVPISDIAHSLVKCEPYCYDEEDQLVELNSLLYFDPFSNLGESTLTELFSSPQENISNEFLLRFAEMAYRNMESYQQILNISELAHRTVTDGAYMRDVDRFYRILEYWRDRSPTYSQLSDALGEYSIFAGRNPITML